MKIIVTGHGHFATGLKSTVTLLAGEIPNVEYIDYTAEMTDNDLAAAFPADDHLLFFCDLAGGTPYKQAVLCSAERKNVAVIAGGNVGALLEVGLQADLTQEIDAHDLAVQLIEASESGLSEFRPKKFEEETEEGGI